jgi:hypothetical protein
VRTNPLNLVVLVIVVIMGMFVFSGMPWAMAIFFPLAYVALGAAVVTTGRRWRDWINPLSIILALGFVRFGLPGLLVLADVDPDVPVFRQMRLVSADWALGHVMAILGLTSLVIGWQMPSRWLGRVLRATFPRSNARLTAGVRYAALAGMVVGTMALLVFVAANASLGDVFRTGEFRRTAIQEGTGPYFRISLLLIAGSVVFAAYLMAMNRAWWVTLVPVSFATMLFWTLGGRARALTPFAAAILLLWHGRGRSRFPVKWGVGVVLIAVLPAVLLAGQLYRGGGGVAAITNAFSVDAVVGYAKGAIWVDWGQLQSLAGAAAIGPGVLGGGTFWRALLWPLSEYVFPINARSGGIFIVETLAGAQEKKWGFHPTLIGDAYLNFGLIGVVVATGIFGVLLKRLYVGWREGWIHGVYYALALLYSARIFFESIERFFEAWLVILFAFSVIRLSQWTLRPARSMAGGRASGANLSSSHAPS